MASPRCDFADFEVEIVTMNMKEIKNVAQLYSFVAREYADNPSFLTKNGGSFSGPNYAELYDMGVALATGLIDLGVSAKDHVGLLADNRLEWIIANYGIQLCGAVDVPRGIDVTDQDIQYILPHAGTKFVFVEHASMLSKLLKNKSKLTDVRHIVVMDSQEDQKENTIGMYKLIEKGKQLREGGDRRVEERIEQTKSEDLCTLIYTSGTTGSPKGVMLTHGNIMAPIRTIPLLLAKTDRALSILPVWHIFERIIEMVTLSKGGSTYYTNIRSIKEDLIFVRPSIMASAPRLWENIYHGLMKKVYAGSPLACSLFRIAYFLAHHYKASLRFLKGHMLDLDGRNAFVSIFLRAPYHLLRVLLLVLPYALFNFVVLRKIRKAMGGCLRFSVSGGGALPLHVDLFFNNIGIAIYEGYGMTETSAALAIRTPSNLAIGSVGAIWPTVQLRLMDVESGQIIYPDIRGRKGEVHVKADQIMKGYYRNPEATEKTLRDGWMNTGDLGVVTYNNTLKIVGRSKETIVLLGGENVEPVPIEGKLLQSDLIENCIVVGQDQKFLTCLVVPSIEGLTEFGKSHKEIASQARAYKEVQKEIKSIVNSQNGFKPFERIIDCRLLEEPFVVGEELTNLFKIKRHVVTEKYGNLIESMYS